MTWDGECREKARDNFPKVPCVRLLDQAKRNITSTALIKAQPRWRKNNDVKANALLRKCGCIQSFHPLSCPMALYSLHVSTQRRPLQNLPENEEIHFLLISSFKAIAPKDRGLSFSQNVKIMRCKILLLSFFKNSQITSVTAFRAWLTVFLLLHYHC